MTPNLEDILRKAFPTGKNWEFDLSQRIPDTLPRLEAVFGRIRATLPVHVDNQESSDMLTGFVVTDINAPRFRQWIEVGRTKQIVYLYEQNAPYVVYHVKVSRIADYYQTFFNFWQPRGDTGSLDIEIGQEPSLLWKERVTAIDGVMQAFRFTRAEKSLLTEVVPFILSWGGDSVPDDDPRWDIHDWQPDPVPSIVYDCLFGDQ